MDGINQAQKLPAEPRQNSLAPGDAKNLSKSAEEFVMIENRLAAQRQKPTDSAQFTSIFGQLRDRLGK